MTYAVSQNMLIIYKNYFRTGLLYTVVGNRNLALSSDTHARDGIEPSKIVTV